MKTSNISTKAINPSTWFLIFIVTHLLCWTLLPSLIRLNLPLDTLEGFIWGQQLQWGYDKDPLLNGWLTRLAVELGGHHDSFIYFFSQCAIAISFWAIWQLAKKFLPPLSALLAVVILEGVQYYNIAAIDFNDNVLQVMLWPLVSLAFYQACTRQTSRAWLLVGVTGALAFLAKYYAIMLFIPMLVLLIIDPKARQSFARKELYLSLAVFCLLITPHGLWLMQHDFLTLHYSFHQASPSSQLSDHFWQPLRFATMQLAALLLPILLLSSLLIGKKQKVLFQQPSSLTQFDKHFLIVIGLGPLACNIIYSAITGNSVHVLWGMPLWSFAGILLLVAIRPLILPNRFYRLMGLIGLLLLAAGFAYWYSLTTAAETSSANYPGKIIAAKASKVWQEHYQQPLRYVAGPRWLAGNIAFYAPSHPAVFMEWDPKVSTWINEAKLRQNGALFVWDETTDKQTIPAQLLKSYPSLKILPSQIFAWSRTQGLKTFSIGMALLPPQ